MYSLKEKCSVTSDNFFRDYKTSKLDNSTRSDFINNRLASALSYNSKNTLNTNQSPKIVSGKYRQTFENKCIK